MVKIIFLGSGGGRYICVNQMRATGGFIIGTYHVDPGPGALLRLLEKNMDPKKLDGVFVSHKHIDHCNDASLIVEALTHSLNKKRGVFVAPKDCSDLLHPKEKASLNRYYFIEKKEKISLEDMNVEVLETRHSEETCLGFKFYTSSGEISYTSDTEYFSGLRSHKGARILILNVTRPRRSRIPSHLSTEDAIELISMVAPELAVMIHLGMKMHPVAEKERKFIEEETDITTIIGELGTVVTMEKNINVEKI
ncbi:MAG: MBL fold metallo-hydrolase [Methanomicrobia archaeon]|nr:MBL fold metallo-hydrolase [Methanomicrobia archaeon]